jgi:E3 ubiquitin-protein ligase TRIP12
MEAAEEAGEAVLAYALAAIANEAAEAGETAAALSVLCDVLALSGPDLIHGIPAKPLANRLPKLAAASASAAEAPVDGDVPLLAARAMAEACEGSPVWAGRFAKHGGVEVLRDHLLAVTSIELAEEVCWCTLPPLVYCKPHH